MDARLGKLTAGILALGQTGTRCEDIGFGSQNPLIGDHGILPAKRQPTGLGQVVLDLHVTRIGPCRLLQQAAGIRNAALDQRNDARPVQGRRKSW